MHDNEKQIQWTVQATPFTDKHTVNIDHRTAVRDGTSERNSSGDRDGANVLGASQGPSEDDLRPESGDDVGNPEAPHVCGATWALQGVYHQDDTQD